MKLNHTPGPWKAEGCSVIAYHKDRSSSIVCNSPLYKDEKRQAEWLSNRHLLAAAPVMLEALRDMVPLFEFFNKKGIPKEADILEDLKKIIESATGKTWEELSK